LLLKTNASSVGYFEESSRFLQPQIGQRSFVNVRQQLAASLLTDYSPLFSNVQVAFNTFDG
jgi:hypothetical protein